MRYLLAIIIAALISCNDSKNDKFFYSKVRINFINGNSDTIFISYKNNLRINNYSLVDDNNNSKAEFVTNFSQLDIKEQK